MRKLFIVGLVLVVLSLPTPVSATEATNSTVYTIEQTHQLPNNSTTAANDVVATIIVFDNYTEYAGQQILSELIEVDGTPVIFDGVENKITRTDDNRVARISLGTINPGSTKTITVTNTIMVTQVGPIDASAVQGSIPGEMLAYTQPVASLWESDNPVIENKALELIAGKSNIYYQAKAIFEFVENHLTYQQQAVEHSALWAYNSRVGDCSEFTHLFSALCRAAGIPTKFVAGYGYDPQKGGDLAAQAHAFAFVYLPGTGWTPMDLTWRHPQGEFAMLSNDHLIELTSYGPNLVRDGEIRIPGHRVNYTYSGQNPDINFVSTGQLVREIAVEPQLSTAALIEGDIWEFYVTVTNEGAQAVTNINVELIADNTYFEVPGAQNISSLGAGTNQAVTFDIRVKESVTNSTVTARVTYDCTYGTFFDEGQIIASATLPPSPEELTDYLMLLIIVVVIVAVVAGVVVARLRR